MASGPVSDAEGGRWRNMSVVESKGTVSRQLITSVIIVLDVVVPDVLV